MFLYCIHTGRLQLCICTGDIYIYNISTALFTMNNVKNIGDGVKKKLLLTHFNVQ